MINNNPYNIPEKPSKISSKILTNPTNISTNLHPNEEDSIYTKNARFVKMNDTNFWDPRMHNDSPNGISIINPRHMPKPVVNMHLSPTSHMFEPPNTDRVISQLSEKLTKVMTTLENHDRTINSLIIDTKKIQKLQQSMQRDMNSIKYNSQMQTVNSLQQDHLKKISEEIHLLRSQFTQNLSNTIKEKREEDKNYIPALIKQLLIQNESNVDKKNKEIEKQLDNKINQINVELNKQINKINENIKNIVNKFDLFHEISSLKPSILKNSGISILLKYSEYFKIQMSNSETKNLEISESVYYIDENGFLLDKQKYYILSNQNKQIRLQKHHLDILRENRVIH